MSPDPALELQDVTAAYGRIEVIHGVSFVVAKGSIVALLGANGAGKSTCLRLASGLMKPASGRILISGRDIKRTSASKLARSACCCVPEGRGIFPNLSVADNVRLWAFGARKPRKEVARRTYERFPRLKERRTQLAGSLSGGEQQMLAMSRALSTDPDVLLLDEISMGIAPNLVVTLYEDIVKLVDQEGLAVLLVEQFADAALAVADHVAVLAQGKVALTGSPSEVRGTLSSVYFEGAAAG